MLSLNHMHSSGDAIFGVMMLVGCLVAGSYPVYKMISWWSEGGVEPFMAFLSIFLYVVLLVSMTMMPPALAMIALAVILAIALAMPLLGQINDEMQLKQMADAEMDRYAAALQENPMNHAARMGLAETLYKRGQVNHALEHMEWLLQAAPGLSMRVRPRIDTWKRELAREGAPPLVICHMCHAENAPNAEACEQCGVAFGTRKNIKQRILREGGPKALIRGWITAMCVLILATFVLMVAPAPVAAAIILATVIVAAWLFLRWAGGDMGTAGS